MLWASASERGRPPGGTFCAPLPLGRASQPVGADAGRRGLGPGQPQAGSDRISPRATTDSVSANSRNTGFCGVSRRNPDSARKQPQARRRQRGENCQGQARGGRRVAAITPALRKDPMSPRHRRETGGSPAREFWRELDRALLDLPQDPSPVIVLGRLLLDTTRSPRHAQHLRCC